MLKMYWLLDTYAANRGKNKDPTCIFSQTTPLLDRLSKNCMVLFFTNWPKMPFVIFDHMVKKVSYRFLICMYLQHKYLVFFNILFSFFVRILFSKET